MTIMDDQAAAAKRIRAHRNPVAGLDRERLVSQCTWVRSVAHHLVRDPWGAEDVMQETLLAALAAPPPEVPDEQRLRAWLGRVAFNLSRLGARQGARRRAREQRVARQESLPSVSDELESRGTMRALTRALEELGKPYRDVVMMRYFDGLSTAEIAARTGTSELAVRKRLWRARNKLRDSIAHDPKTGRILAGLLSINLAARGWRTAGLAGLAAGVVATAGVAWWSSEPAPEATVARLAVPEALVGRAGGSASVGAQVPFAPDERADAPTRPESGRRPLREGERGEGPRRETPPPAPEVAAAALVGSVVDLDGRAVAGLEIFDPAQPVRALARSDALGTFQLEHAGPEALRRVAARGPGWTTVVPARLGGTDARPSPVVVAVASALDAWTVDEQGRPLAGVRIEVLCEETAFTRIAEPVHLDSPLLARFETDAEGVLRIPTLPRARGIRLALQADGFEPLALATTLLGRSERFVLRAERVEALTGIVRYPDGRLAAGAHVRLGEGRATADRLGRFRLPVRGVTVGSCLEASDADKSAGPTRLPGFGARLHEALGSELELVLGEPYEPVEGKLVGDDEGGWIVAAFPLEGGPLDASGAEIPAALAESDLGGGFRLALPDGAYDLYAVAPDATRAVHRVCSSSARDWRIELPPGATLDATEGSLESDDGLPLGDAEIQVRALLDGRGGERRVVLPALRTRADGTFRVARAPAVELELDVAHARLGRAPRRLALASGEGSQPVRLARASYLRVDGAPAQRGTLLAADGRPLAAHGPLGSAEGFSLAGGQSAVLEIPAEARWLELSAPGVEPWAVPLVPRPGEVLGVRP